MALEGSDVKRSKCATCIKASNWKSYHPVALNFSFKQMDCDFLNCFVFCNDEMLHLKEDKLETEGDFLFNFIYGHPVKRAMFKAQNYV
jgi:Pyruvate/2-oxoacid:ferredoxin oxidoreductase delta subunit